jgi:CheY-like chemotaxis protein
MAEKTVMIVEDDADIREALTALLVETGYSVACAGDGEDALRQLKAGARPAVVLLDLMMPVMTGAEFRQAQLADPELAGIPIVVLTAAGRFRERAAALGAAAAFPKPFEVHDLLATLARLSGETGWVAA